jgi:adenylate cyclase
MADVRSVVDWLADGARSAPRAEDVLRELCHRMIAAGLPIRRAAVFVNTLHPNIFGRRFTWQAGKGVAVVDGQYALMETDEYLTSPITAVRANGEPIRRHLASSDCPMDFPVLAELRSEGATDYVAVPLVFTDSSVHVATWSTQQPGGFNPAQFADLESITAPLTRVAEIRALRRTATNLLDTYVGRQAGERILMGEIRRGHVEAIRAVIWLSDMRGFTATAERLPPQELVDLLNQYFDCQVPPILNHGGEVLKFMGDGLLAIFPLNGNGDNAPEVCTRALAGAREAEILIDKLDSPACVARKNMVRFGLALHVGQVMYGNIGGGNRLDFTCIGPAVNLAARLEKVAAQLGQTIVASAEFAQHVPGQFSQRGECTVAGFSAPQAVLCLTAPQQ